MYFTNLNVDINEVNISKIVISIKISFGKKGFKCFIGYKMMIKLSHCAQCCQKWGAMLHILMKDISSLVEDEKLLKTHSKVWDKISNIKQKGSDSELVYNEK